MAMKKDFEVIIVLSKRVLEKIITYFDTVTIFKRKKYVSVASTGPKCG